MVSSNVIVEVTISGRLFVFRQSFVQISAGLTNVSGLAVAEFEKFIVNAKGHGKGLVFPRCSVRFVNSSPNLNSLSEMFKDVPGYGEGNASNVTTCFNSGA